MSDVVTLQACYFPSPACLGAQQPKQVGTLLGKEASLTPRQEHTCAKQHLPQCPRTPGTSQSQEGLGDPGVVRGPEPLRVALCGWTSETTPWLLFI